MPYEIFDIIIYATSGLIGAIIGGILSPVINYRLNIKYKERELKLNWKREEFREIVKKLDEKITNWEEIRNHISFEKCDKKEIIRMIDKEVLEDKIKFSSSFLSFNHEMLNLSTNLMTKETFLGIKIKKGIKEGMIKNQEIEYSLMELRSLINDMIYLMKKDLKL